MAWNSLFGAGSGNTAFAYDMMVLDSVKKEKQKNNCNYLIDAVVDKLKQFCKSCLHVPSDFF